MRVFIAKNERVVNWIDAPGSAAALQETFGGNYLCIDDPGNGMSTGWTRPVGGVFGPPLGPAEPRLLALADFLRRIPRTKRNAIRAARVNDENLNDACDLLYTYAAVDLDDRNIKDFAAFLAANGNITQAEATALLL